MDRSDRIRLLSPVFSHDRPRAATRTEKHTGIASRYHRARASNDRIRGGIIAREFADYCNLSSRPLVTTVLNRYSKQLLTQLFLTEKRTRTSKGSLLASATRNGVLCALCLRSIIFVCPRREFNEIQFNIRNNAQLDLSY